MGNHRTDLQAVAADLVGQSLDPIGIEVDVYVRLIEEKVDAVEADPIDGGRRGEAEHRIQINRGLGIGAFAHQAGPHGIVQLREHFSWERFRHVPDSLSIRKRAAR